MQSVANPSFVNEPSMGAICSKQLFRKKLHQLPPDKPPISPIEKQTGEVTAENGVLLDLSCKRKEVAKSVEPENDENNNERQNKESKLQFFIRASKF